MNRTRAVLCGLWLLSALAACSSDCAVVCEQRKECGSANIDLESCTETCGTWAEEKDDQSAKVEECAQCVEDRVCSEAIKACIDDCWGVPGW